jgi:hypothetical protein
MKRYLFFVNNNYCYPILKPLQVEILKRGGAVNWFVLETSTSQLSTGDVVLQTTKDVFRFNPDAVITPGNWLPYYFPGKKVQATGRKLYIFTVYLTGETTLRMAQPVLLGKS